MHGESIRVASLSRSAMATAEPGIAHNPEREVMRNMKHTRWFTAGVVGMAMAAFAGSQGVLADGQSGATPAASAIPPNYAAQAAQGARDQQAIDLATPYVSRNADGTLSLTLPASVQAAIGSSERSRLQADLQGVDGRISAGQLATTASGRVFDPRDSTVSIQGGWTGVGWNWWGVQLFLSHNLVRTIASWAGGDAYNAAAGTCAAVSAYAQQYEAALICGIAWATGGALRNVIEWADPGNGVIVSVGYWAAVDGMPWLSWWINGQ